VTWQLLKSIGRFKLFPYYDQQAVDTTFDNDIDEHDLVMSAAQYDNLVDSIKRGQTELHPLSDTTNIPAVASVDNTYGIQLCWTRNDQGKR
jgi:hypothetical protein